MDSDLSDAMIISGRLVSSLMVFTNGEKSKSAMIKTLKPLSKARNFVNQCEYSANLLSLKYMRKAYPTPRATQNMIYHHGYEKLIVLITCLF